jgi:hypothetical protein
MPVAETIHEVVHNMWMWHAYDPSVKADLSSFALRTDYGLIIVDPILLSEEGMLVLREASPWAAIVLTNGNHARASLEFKRRSGVPIFAHPDAARELEIPVDEFLKIGGRVGGNLELLDLQGAGSGEVALYHPAGSIHFGDAVVNLESTGLDFLPEKYCSSQSRLKTSMQALQGRRVDIMTFAHGLPIVTDTQSRFDALVQRAKPSL